MRLLAGALAAFILWGVPANAGAPHSTFLPSVVPELDVLVAQAGCQPRRTCSQIGSCDEAKWYLANCSWGGALDRDSDGAPCETLCGSNN
jgi:hypothetical protein